MQVIKIVFTILLLYCRARKQKNKLKDCLAKKIIEFKNGGIQNDTKKTKTTSIPFLFRCLDQLKITIPHKSSLKKVKS